MQKRCKRLSMSLGPANHNRRPWGKRIPGKPRHSDRIGKGTAAVNFDPRDDTRVMLTAIWLAGWNMNLMTFHSVGNVIIPTDELTPSFFRGVGLNHQPIMFYNVIPSYNHI